MKNDFDVVGMFCGIWSDWKGIYLLCFIYQIIYEYLFMWSDVHMSSKIKNIFGNIMHFKTRLLYIMFIKALYCFQQVHFRLNQICPLISPDLYPQPMFGNKENIHVCLLFWLDFPHIALVLVLHIAFFI